MTAQPIVPPSRPVTVVPAATSTDAWIRAIRTFVQGALVVVAGAVITAITAAATGGIQWTSTYWIGLAVVGGQAALTALVSYVSRFVKPPTTS